MSTVRRFVTVHVPTVQPVPSKANSRQARAVCVSDANPYVNSCCSSSSMFSFATYLFFVAPVSISFRTYSSSFVRM